MALWLTHSARCGLFRQREGQAGAIEPDRADFIHRRRIDPAQLARGGNRGLAVGAVDDIEPQQLLLAFGEGPSVTTPLPGPRNTQASLVAPSRAAGPMRFSLTCDRAPG